VNARSAPVRTVIYLIELYRHTISPLRLPTCRFTPTCSQYAVEALTEFGIIRGGALALLRLMKCGPWHDGGWDPIPDRRTRRDERDSAAAECACGRTNSNLAGYPTSTVQQGKSQTSV
jgi:putative membrane protein insertion efficiency factor